MPGQWKLLLKVYRQSFELITLTHNWIVQLYSNMLNILKHSQKWISTLAKRYMTNYSEDSNGCRQPSEVFRRAPTIEFRRALEEFRRLSKISQQLVVFSLLTNWIQSLKDVRAQKFPRTDFFKTLTAGRKW